VQALKSIVAVLAELPETVNLSSSLETLKSMFAVASGTIDVTAVLDTVKHLGTSFVELVESLPFSALLEAILPEVPLTVEVAILIGIIALTIALCAFAYVATRPKD
jgi:hypothetical protein